MSVFDDYWTNAAGGDYGTAGNWSEMVPYAPNASEVAVLGQVGTSTTSYAVTTSAATGGYDQLGALQISSYATLEFVAGDYTAADQLDVTNAGKIEAFGIADVYPGLDIIFAKGTFTNSGTVDFVGGAKPNFGDASSLNFEGAVTNTGLIESNGEGGLLDFLGGALTNQGQILSEGAYFSSTTDDVVGFRNETIDNAGGVIGSTLEGIAIIGSGVDLSGGTLTGMVDFSVLNAASVLDDVTISSTKGTVLYVEQSYVAGSGDYDEVEGMITNEAVVIVSPQLGITASALAIEGDVTLTGGGQVRLYDGQGGAAIVSASGSSELYNGNNVIEGSGQIESANGGTLMLVNSAGGESSPGQVGILGDGVTGPYKYASASNLDIDTGQMVTNQGVIETGVHSTMTIKDAIDNTGHIAANWASLLISGAVTGAGLGLD